MTERIEGTMPDDPQNDLPPYPWPKRVVGHSWQNCPPGGALCLGSPGTVWTFKASSLRIRLIAIGADESRLDTLGGIVSTALGYLQKWSRSQQCDPDPNDPDPDPRMAYLAPDLGEGMSVNVYRAAVHAAFGPFEDLEHVFHLRAKGGITQDTTEVGLQALAARVGAAWSAFWENDTEYNGDLGLTATKAMFTPVLSYDKITMSYLTYPGDWFDEPNKVVNPPVTVTPSTDWTFATPLAGTGTTYYTLPAEVALCLTLLTDEASKRTRGRVYLGGLTSALLQGSIQAPAVQGFFSNYVKVLGFRFGTSFVAGLHNDEAAQAELNIVSRIGGSSRGVGGVKVGLVPDSQRRRRWHMPENPTLVWGTA